MCWEQVHVHGKHGETCHAWERQGTRGHTQSDADTGSRVFKKSRSTRRDVRSTMELAYLRTSESVSAVGLVDLRQRLPRGILGTVSSPVDKDAWRGHGVVGDRSDDVTEGGVGGELQQLRGHMQLTVTVELQVLGMDVDLGARLKVLYGEGERCGRSCDALGAEPLALQLVTALGTTVE